jgi:hypothetical protein
MQAKPLTKRERFLKALRNEPVDELVWAPNFDYWLGVNREENTLPEKYRDMSRNDIVRAVGATIWNRASGLKAVRDPAVKERTETAPDGAQIQWIQTPVGTIRQVHSPTLGEGPRRSPHLSEHFVKDLESLRVMRYVAEATHYEADYERTRQALRETGDDGIVLNPCFCVPFIQFAKTDAGYVQGFYLWTDHRKEVDALIAAYFDGFLQGYRVLADGPADVVATGDNMDGTTISPPIFREYAIPFYQEARRILAPKGKIFEGHWCGRTQSLLPQVPGCGLDVVEAIVTRPMADVSLAEALDMLRGEVVLQGGIPSVLVCEEGGRDEDFERYIREVVVPLKGRKGFILGLSDNVPPNARFSRVEAVAGLIR